MKKLIVCLTMIAIAEFSFAQTTVSGVNFPATHKLDKSDLKLNGAGIRKKAGFIEVYVAGMYLKHTSKDGNAIMKADEPQNVHIVITSSLVNSKNFIEATKEGFQKSTSGNTKPIQAKVDKFLSLFLKESISKGDAFDLNYIPGKGVEVLKKGKFVDVIPGLDFKTALFGIWIGNDPVDSKLKTGLLGQ